MPNRVLAIDFEFNQTVEPQVNLVCAATLDLATGEKKTWWLHKSNDRSPLKDYLKKFDTILSYAAVAEARSFLALGLNPLDWNFIDLFLEYRLVCNHNDNLNWGKQLVDGRVKFVKKPLPKWERSDDDSEAGTGFRPTHSLAEATYKLTGQIRDTDHKSRMRDLIISGPDSFNGADAQAILDYCLEDVVHLPELKNKIYSEFCRLVGNDSDHVHSYMDEAFTRARYAAHTAIMESFGYPIDVEKTRNFSDQVPSILAECQREINQLFPSIKPFKWNKLKQQFTWDQKKTRAWIAEHHDVERWPKTDTGAISLALDAWTSKYNFSHDYPTDNFGAQMVRYLKLKQSLYGFSANTASKKRTFWDSVGSDGRARAYLNIYGAQSSRSQPAATGFMFLKPAWMRALVQPKPGRFMSGIDYGSQEFFISALESRDQNMIQAYLSGDPYLAFGKIAGIIPPDGTKATHKFERNACKSTVLGISYLMTKYGLAIKLSNDTGREWDEDEAQEQIDLFYEAFPDLAEYQTWIQECYREDGYIKLPCGWYMFGDNPNHRSVTNMRIQGFGASVMRKAVDLAVAQGCNVSFTLHDALYIEDEIGAEHKIKVLRDCMREAFAHYFPDEQKDVARKIKLDPFAWSPDFKPDSEIDVGGWLVPANDLYLDERAERDYKLFSRYFDKQGSDWL